LKLNNREEKQMPPRKKVSVCEIVFGKLTIPVYEASRGKEIIDGIFLIGAGGEKKREIRRRRKGAGRKKGRLADKIRRQRKVSKLAEKGMPKAHIAKKLGVSPITVSKDLKEAKKE
jgi:DNA-binding NarL/FixJ family response regulator